MNPLLIAAYKLSQLRPRPLRVLFVQSNQHDFDERYIRKMFSPWAPWSQIVGAVPFENLDKALETSFDNSFGNSSQTQETAVLVLLDPKHKDSLGHVAHVINSKGITLVTSEYPEFGTLDNDFCREIAHHDFEIGGKNEWDGAPTRYSHYMLRLLSSTHSKDSFPIHVYEELLEIQRQTQAFPLEALDLGCGPLSWLRWGVLQGLLRVTGVDPLLDVYETVLARHGLDAVPNLLPSQRYSVRFEEFGHESALAKFHFVYTNNALDHTQDPLTVITQLATVLSPQGIAVIQVATNEGTRQNWDQLHKYDIYYENNVINCRNQAGHVQTLVSSETPLRLHKVILNTDESLIFSATRNFNRKRAFQSSASLGAESNRQQTGASDKADDKAVSESAAPSAALANVNQAELQIKLRQAQAKNQRLQRKLREAEQAYQVLTDLKERIGAMESSKFWQLRTQWIKLKNRLGLPE